MDVCYVRSNIQYIYTDIVIDRSWGACFRAARRWEGDWLCVVRRTNTTVWSYNHRRYVVARHLQRRLRRMHGFKKPPGRRVRKGSQFRKR